jgi:hypothetical protein
MTLVTHLCDRCGRPILKGETRYLARIEVQASAAPLEITEADLQRDLTLQREHLIEQTEAMTEEELMRDVYVELKFDLCRRCQRTWLQNPLIPPPLPPEP